MPTIEKIEYIGVRPVYDDYPISLPFGAERNYWKNTKYHRGVDFACPVNTPVRFFDLGVVEFAGNRGDGFGNYICVLHPNNFRSFYCHLNLCFVGTGDKVRRGGYCAASGATGNVKGAHLHFELRNPQGKPINPMFEEEKYV